jgi:hypothetical protein
MLGVRRRLMVVTIRNPRIDIGFDKPDSTIGARAEFERLWEFSLPGKSHDVFRVKPRHHSDLSL